MHMALEKCLPSFIGNKSSWGVDSVWSKILDYPEDKLIVFDACYYGTYKTCWWR